MSDAPEGKTPPTKPPEGMRDVDRALIVCIAPSVNLTPVGNTMVPIPYNVIDYGGHDSTYAKSVRFTANPSMLLRSHSTHVHGDEAGTGGGVMSGTRGGICEPIQHEPTVRAEGSPIIRHNDLHWMNNKNTVGRAVLIDSTATNALPRPQPRSWRESFGDQFMQHSGTAQDVRSVGNKLSEYWNDPGAISRDAARLRDSLPSLGEVRDGALAAGRAGLEAARRAIDDPHGTAQAVGQSISNTVQSTVDGTRRIYQQDGVAGVAGAGVGVLGDLISPSRKGHMVREGVEAAAEVGQRQLRHEAREQTQGAAARAAAGGVRVSRLNNYDFEIDALGRTTRARGELKLNKAERDPTVQRAAGGADRLADDHGGHLIGSRFDGPGGAANTVAQNQNLNQGAWKAMENSWERALRDGREVFVDIRPQYTGGSLRPSSFDVRYTIDGQLTTRVFNNRPGG